MRFLVRNSLVLFISLFFFSFINKSNDYFNKSKPIFEYVKYRTSIDVIGKHLSGILIIKQQEDSSHRVVFVNEMGVTFFDYTFFENKYQVNQIIESLDKKAVKKTLAKDLGMILQKGIFKPNPTFNINQSGGIQTYQLQKKGTVQYFYELDCKQINTIKNFGKRKAVISTQQFYSSQNQSPDSIFVQHHTVNFTISLKQLYATE